MALPAGRLTRGTIITQGLNRAGNPKIKVAARYELNRLLQDLYSQYEWPFLSKRVDVTLSGSTYTLPSDWLRAAEDCPLRVIASDGVEVSAVLTHLDPAAFEIAAFPSTTTAPYPTIFTIDATDGVIRFWPSPSVPCTARLRYTYLPADVAVSGATTDTTYDADIPVFVDHGFLVDWIEWFALDYDQDARAGTKKMECEARLAKILGRALPHKTIADTLLLDPDTFRTPFRQEF